MKLQEDMEFLESVREDVRNDMHEILVHRRTAEKEVLMKAMGNRWGSALAACACVRVERVAIELL